MPTASTHWIKSSRVIKRIGPEVDEAAGSLLMFERSCVAGQADGVATCT